MDGAPSEFVEEELAGLIKGYERPMIIKDSNVSISSDGEGPSEEFQSLSTIYN